MKNSPEKIETTSASPDKKLTGRSTLQRYTRFALISLMLTVASLTGCKKFADQPPKETDKTELVFKKPDTIQQFGQIYYDSNTEKYLGKDSLRVLETLRLRLNIEKIYISNPDDYVMTFIANDHTYSEISGPVSGLRHFEQAMNRYAKVSHVLSEEATNLENPPLPETAVNITYSEVSEKLGELEEHRIKSVLATSCIEKIKITYAPQQNAGLQYANVEITKHVRIPVFEAEKPGSSKYVQSGYTTEAITENMLCCGLNKAALIEDLCTNLSGMRGILNQFDFAS